MRSKEIIIVILIFFPSFINFFHIIIATFVVMDGVDVVQYIYFFHNSPGIYLLFTQAKHIIQVCVAPYSLRLTAESTINRITNDLELELNKFNSDQDKQ